MGPVDAPLLEGVRVLDVSRVLAGPFAGQVLAEMGADVVKAEFGAGDPARAVGPFLGDRSLYFSSVNSGKRGVLIADDPDGRRLLGELIGWADILLSNFRAPAARDLGLDFDAVGRRNPAVVMVNVTGYAETSSRAGDPAYDLSIQAEAGILAVTGTPGGAPARAGVPISDLVAGLWAALGAAGGLVARARTGRGRYLEVPLLDGTLPLLSYMATAAAATGDEPPRVASGHHSIVPYGAYATEDGWLVIAVLADKFWPPLCAALSLDLDVEELATNAARVAVRAQIDSAVAVALSRMPRSAALERLAQAGVPCAPVHRLLDALATPYVAERGLVQSVATGEGAYTRVVGPFGALLDPSSLRPAPALGEHTRDVAVELGLERRSAPPTRRGTIRR